MFVSSQETINLKPVSLTTFIRTCNSYPPNIGFISPQSDLCDVCAAFMRRVSIARMNGSAAGGDIARSLFAQWTIHRNLAAQERRHYAEMIKRAANPLAHIIHLSFDYSQKITVPYSAQQILKAYFKVASSVHVFGMAEEARRKCQLFLCPEGSELATGASSRADAGNRLHAGSTGCNAVISQLHSALLMRRSE